MSNSCIWFFVAGFVCGMAFLPLMHTILEFLKKYWLILLVICTAIILLWKGPAIVKFICNLCNQVCQ